MPTSMENYPPPKKKKEMVQSAGIQPLGGDEASRVDTVMSAVCPAFKLPTPACFSGKQGSRMPLSYSRLD